MKKILKPLCIAILTFSVMSCNNEKNEQIVENPQQKITEPSSLEGKIIPNQYIVVLKDEVIKSARARFEWKANSTRESKAQEMEALNLIVEGELNNWLAKNNIPSTAVVFKHKTTFVGFTVNLAPDAFNTLKRNPSINFIECDRIEEIPTFQVEESKTGNATEAVLAQTTPCGITNAGGAATTVSTDRWVWVIDSGIDLDHPDLNVITNTTYAKTFATGTTTPDDENGHGTHVAGTIGAKNNTIGVIGVAPNAPVVPVRVFGATGGSSTSVIINGINHVATYDAPGDVVNMSLGGYFGSNCATNSSYKSAVTSLAVTSKIAIAAGNDAASSTLYQPGCLNGTNIYTVASMTCSKTFSSSFSNFGTSTVDWIATGSSVYSTYKNGGYATLSGTSMATPHVAGIMQVRNAAPAQNGSVTYNGATYKIAVR
ncbi:S8 family peptidase [Flavobacterium difficile]|uniref:S8 family serine peptidase n=1 Tax=Flavobacterium difficile TaxID=2709659 RepID=A0ABX0HZY2_9FLAO|nr:S8 family serine peptidase [Flavobacterium difficile]NHM00513.1 S8 family serine peptidase [Flavobacterium difficile]